MYATTLLLAAIFLQQWMPRVRKITPDEKSAIILTVDQMPGARAPKPSESASYNFFSVEFFDLLLRSFFYLIGATVRRPQVSVART